jgi:predicted MFS family arabinose efflux permease
VYAIVKANGDGWGSGPTVGFGLGGLALLGVFLVVERLTTDPLVDLSLFRSRSVSVANAAIVLLMGANAAFFFTMTIYLQHVLGYSPLRTGFAFVPLSAGMLVGATLAGKFIGKIGLRPQAIAGLVFGVAAFLLLTQLATGGNVYFTGILAPFLLNSIGIGMALVPLTVLATENVRPRLAGLASGVFNTSMQAGGALGLAILGTLAATRTASRARHYGSTLTRQRELAATVSGYHLLFLVGSSFFVVAALLLAFAVRRRDLPATASEAPMSDVLARAESEGVEAVGF